jgi:hypothetical protein
MSGAPLIEYAVTLLSAWIFPLLALVAAVATLGSLLRFIRDIYLDRNHSE